jgi:hypothetical protein
MFALKRDTAPHKYTDAQLLLDAAGATREISI